MRNVSGIDYGDDEEEEDKREAKQKSVRKIRLKVVTQYFIISLALGASTNYVGGIHKPCGHGRGRVFLPNAHVTT